MALIIISKLESELPALRLYSDFGIIWRDPIQAENGKRRELVTREGRLRRTVDLLYLKEL